MKKTTIILLLFCSVYLWSQNDKKSFLQKNKYNLAVSCLQNKQLDKAIDSFLFAYKINPESEAGKISKVKIDSLIPIVRKNLVNQLTGTWKLIGNQPIWILKEQVNNKVSDTMMVITSDQVSYYVKNIKSSEQKFLKANKIEFYNGLETTNPVIEMVDSGNELWFFIIDASSKNLRIINTGNKTVSGRNNIYLDNKELYYTRVK
ncbi:MAG: hypothetical protein ABI892_12015 [Flavobacterium sp.]